MALLAKQITRDFLILIPLYVFTRTAYILRYPIFNDEAIYVRYGQIMVNNPLQRFYSVAHSGKQPLVYWLFGLFNRFVEEPLLAARFVSIGFGFITLLVLYVLVWRTGSRRSPLIVGLLYIVCPLAIFFDRLALVDSALTMLYAALCFILVAIPERQWVKKAALLGVLIGTSLWIKSTGLLFMVASITVMFFMKLRNALLMIAIIIISASIIISPLAFRPEVHRVFEMTSEYVVTSGEFFQSLGNRVLNNVVSFILVYIGYVSPFVLFSVFFMKWSRVTRILLWMVIVPTVLVILISRSIHGRYVFFTLPPLLAIASVFLSQHKKLLIMTLATMAMVSAILIVDPVKYFHLFPKFSVFGTESWQYVDGWPSGYGVREALSYVDVSRGVALAFIAVRWDSGNPEDAVLLYGPRTPNMAVGHLDERLSTYQTIKEASGIMPMYLITRAGQLGNFRGKRVLLKRFPKPGGEDPVEVYKLIL